MATGTIAIAIAAMMSFCIVGPAVAQGIVASKTMEAISRQPEAAGELKSTMIMALSLIEALAIYGLLIGFILAGKI